MREELSALLMAVGRLEKKWVAEEASVAAP